jgi:hypothetical protein
LVNLDQWLRFSRIQFSTDDSGWTLEVFEVSVLAPEMPDFHGILG